jgi:tripartite-type tricarboxylate transporter receptor subunit TctC
LQEFIALAKSKPGQLNYASTGSGGSSHLASEMLNLVAEIKLQHVPYKGGSQALTDVIGGQVQTHMNNPLIMIPHIKSGRLKALAITGASRLPALPQVPTFSEAGLPRYDARVWYGVLTAAGTPNIVINKLSTEIARILAMPDIKEKLLSQGLEPFISTPKQFAALMQADMVKYARVIKTANIKLEN